MKPKVSYWAKTPEPFDPNRKWARVTGINRLGFVEFEFTIGAKELTVELMLRPEAFDEFCEKQKVEVHDPHQLLPNRRS
ncbi:phenol hydroxylase subunit [Hydrogenophilus thermoluteolus]|uniref:Phenol hydroxylase subunit n=1 Tax=Hydrogenophilus thermoluteolus TaxID=297 RepID=A0A2Z6DV67_HYDTE|nr:phenol hydroxylase subunit [Hydrogenophilus thermoluteolus]MBW7656831.1 phenol hydroxylase subunit [Hydrogenophilus thermoluteolus]BBD76327.1 phenol hydroxylase subunit [Hydrogenophilus thermoluteolus]